MLTKVKCIPFPNIPNAYVVISGVKTNTSNGVEKRMTFFYVNGQTAVEWEPDYGPITILYNCSADTPMAEPHWYYDYVEGYGHWSQLAVNEELLGEKFIDGDWEALFAVLKRWAQ